MKASEATCDSVVTTKVQGAERAEAVDLPDTIRVLVPIFVGCEPRTVDFDLLVEASREGEVYASLAGACVLKAQIEEMQDQADALKEALAPDVESGRAIIGYGEPALSDWQYLVLARGENEKPL